MSDVTDYSEFLSMCWSAVAAISHTSAAYSTTDPLIMVGNVQLVYDGSRIL